MTAVDTNKAEAIAKAFAALMKAELSEAEYNEMRRRNGQEPAYQGDACASHDFLDANMVMADAFDLRGEKDCTDFDDGTPEHEAACALWNDAWAIAKRDYLTAPSTAEAA